MNNTSQKELTDKLTANPSSLELSQLESLQSPSQSQNSSSQRRRISTEEFQDIVGKAYLLQEFDQEQRIKLRAESLEVMTSLGFEQGIPVERVPEIIQSRLDIDSKYTQRILDIYFPTQEQKLQDLKSRNAEPSIEAVANKYLVEIEKAMNKNFPKDKYSVYRGRSIFHDENAFGKNKIYIDIIEEKTEERKIFFLKNKRIIRKRRNIARILIKFDNKIQQEIYDPIFLRVCGKVLDSLNTRFKQHFNYSNPLYDYDPEGS